jgi:hypothetical protein
MRAQQQDYEAAKRTVTWSEVEHKVDIEAQAARYEYLVETIKKEAAKAIAEAEDDRDRGIADAEERRAKGIADAEEERDKAEKARKEAELELEASRLYATSNPLLNAQAAGHFMTETHESAIKLSWKVALDAEQLRLFKPEAFRIRSKTGERLVETTVDAETAQGEFVGPASKTQTPTLLQVRAIGGNGKLYSAWSSLTEPVAFEDAVVAMMREKCASSGCRSPDCCGHVPAVLCRVVCLEIG